MARTGPPDADQGARPATPPRPRRRRRWLLLALLVALPIILVATLRWALQPERLGALLLERASAATGLQLDVSEPAELGIWPGLHLELVGLQARQPGQLPLLTAARVDVALPLSLLWRREVELADVTLHEPTLHLDGWQRWRAAEVEQGPPPPPSLPDFAARVSIERGSVQGNGWRLEQLRLDAAPLRHGSPFRARGSALLRRMQAEQPFEFEVELVPLQTAEGITLQDIALALGDGDDAARLQVDGRASIGTALLSTRLQVRLPDRWPASWPPLADAVQHGLAGREFVLDYAGTPDLDGTLALRSDVPSPLAASGNPRELLGWLGASSTSPLPPIAASLRLERLELDGVVVDGLQIELQPSAPSEPPVDE